MTRTALLIVWGIVGSLLANPAGAQTPTIYTYSGDTKIDCPRCLNKPYEKGMTTRPNTPNRRAACLHNKRCTADQLKGLAIGQYK
jgi:hypothetical protein